MPWPKGKKWNDPERLERFCKRMKGENNPKYGVKRMGEDNPNYGKKHPDMNLKGSEHPQWKGDNIVYQHLHWWIRKLGMGMSLVS